MEIVSLILSIFAIVVAMCGLVFSIYSDNRKFECEFRYKAYDRLNQLASMIQDHIRQTADRMDEAKSVKSPEEATTLLNKYLVDFADGVTIASWNLQLHRLSIPEEVFKELNKKSAEIEESYTLLDATRKEGKATQEGMLNYVASVDSFWRQMGKVIESTLEETASEIRRKCQ